MYSSSSSHSACANPELTRHHATRTSSAKPEIGHPWLHSRCPTIFQILSRWLWVMTDLADSFMASSNADGGGYSTTILQPSSIQAIRRHSLSTHFVSLHDTFWVSYQQVQGNKLQQEDVCVAQLWEKMGRSCIKKHATTGRTATLHHVSNCFTRISFLTFRYFQRINMFIIIMILTILQEITQLSQRRCHAFICMAYSSSVLLPK